MGNLRQSMTDEEWNEIEERIKREEKNKVTKLSPKKEIVLWLQGDKSEALPIPMMPLAKINTLLESEGYERTGYDSNGWQIDFWLIYSKEKEEETIELSGSLYHGNFRLSK